MDWLYLSPHLDDAAYSCGGLIWEQTRQGMGVEIVTVCAGDPPDAPLSPFAASLHARWGTGPEAIKVRRQEDEMACRVLGAQARHLNVPDCIYRVDSETGEALYASETAIFGLVNPGEKRLVKQVADIFWSRIKDGCQVAAPLGLGGHVDHRLVLAVVQALLRESAFPLWFYADYPYVLQEQNLLGKMQSLRFTPRTSPVSDEGVHAWSAAAGCHVSQISTFWGSTAVMEAAFRDYAGRMGGVVLWQPQDLNQIYQLGTIFAG